MRVAIVGSRGWKDVECIRSYISKLPQSAVIISGGAKGVDSIAAEIARGQSLEVVEYIPDWDKHGKQAGFIRNEQIVSNCDALLAFWDGKSKGTKHSIDLALAAEHVKRITIVKEEFHEQQ